MTPRHFEKGKFMTKDTFNNLPTEKKEIVIKALKKEFEEYSILDASVASIIKRAGISRGSFYQYFDNLEYSFFTILEEEAIEIHDIFMHLLIEQEGDLFSALKLYGEAVAEELFKKEKYNLYKNRFLHWTSDLDEKWKKFHRVHQKSDQKQHMKINTQNLKISRDEINYLSAVIKKLIEDMYINEWDRQTFLEKYNQYVTWLEYGLGKEKN